MFRILFPLLAASAVAMAQQSEWTGSIVFEGFGFSQDGLSEAQDSNALSFAVEPEYYRDWDDGRQNFIFKPFFRYDNRDSERTHGDLRELSWLVARQKWELRLGVRKVFWGVAESLHLVDIVNQTDLAENLDGEEKLGQPMVNFAWIDDWGALDLFMLSGFRERVFPGEDGRFRTPVHVDADQASYESDAEEWRLSWAARYSKSFGPWDLGVSHFSGTSREPLLQPGFDSAGAPVLTPHYPIIDQSSVDLQGTFGGWLLKLESAYRQGFGDEDYAAAVGGFEYTFPNINGRGLDIGALAEYLYDERGQAATTAFAKDLFVGARLAFNDVQSSEILAGAAFDLNGDGVFFNVEAERRIGANWTIAMELRGFTRTAVDDPLHAFRNDDHLRIELTRFF